MRNAQYKSQEKLEAESLPSLHSGSLARRCRCSSPDVVCGCAPLPGPGSHPAHRCLQHTWPEQARAKRTGDVSFESPILEPPSPKNPTWKLLRCFPWDKSSLAHTHPKTLEMQLSTTTATSCLLVTQRCPSQACLLPVYLHWRSSN